MIKHINQLFIIIEKKNIKDKETVIKDINTVSSLLKGEHGPQTKINVLRSIAKLTVRVCESGDDGWKGGTQLAVNRHVGRRGGGGSVSGDVSRRCDDAVTWFETGCNGQGVEGEAAQVGKGEGGAASLVALHKARICG